MGATTTQGTGPGMAQIKPGFVGKKHKETTQVSLSVNNFIGPRVVAAGSVKLDGVTGIINIPAQVGNPRDYCVMLTNNSASNPYVSSGITENETGWYFSVTAGSGDLVNYLVLRSGS